MPGAHPSTATTQLDEGRAIANAPQHAHACGPGGVDASGVRRSSGQLVAALAATSLDDRSAGTGGHAVAEPVVLRPLAGVRLVRSLHGGPSWSSPVVAGRSIDGSCRCRGRGGTRASATAEPSPSRPRTACHRLARALGRRTTVPVPVAQVPDEGYRDVGSTNDRDTASLLKLEGDRQPRQRAAAETSVGRENRLLTLAHPPEVGATVSFVVPPTDLPTTRALVLAWELWIAVTGLGEEIRVVH